ncbi:MAG: amidohydrolase family protein [Myxococcales bacterium]|nr:amidohydrolase family protein [Myxococcales bacterium]
MALTGAGLFLDGGAEVLSIDGGTVSAVGQAAPASARVLDCRGLALGPGAINAHTHLYSGLAPLGLPPPEPPPQSFLQILERLWWRLDCALDEPSLRASAELYIAEALLAGTTTLIDHHESPCFIEGSLDVLADAAERLGCRLATGYGATDRNGGPDEGLRGLDECRRFARERPRRFVRPLAALHASFTVGDETVRHAADLGLPMHVHVAEDAADVTDAKQRGFAGPLERLLTLGALPRGSIVAHGVHLTLAQVRAADDSGLWLVQNPRSNAGNRVGYARALDASTRVALGTDGYPADMRIERAALREESERAGHPLSDDTVAARVRGGHALASSLFGVRLEPELAPGCAADVVAWRGDAVIHVIVDGELVVENGRLTRGDLDAIRAHAREQAPRLWQRMKELA